MFIDTPRFIQYTMPNGVKRYYDATIEFVPMDECGLYSYEYRAIRLFDINEIEKFNKMAEAEIGTDGMTSTLDFNEYDKRDTVDWRRIAPFLTDDGDYVSSIAHACSYFDCTVSELPLWLQQTE